MLRKLFGLALIAALVTVTVAEARVFGRRGGGCASGNCGGGGCSSGGCGVGPGVIFSNGNCPGGICAPAGGGFYLQQNCPGGVCPTPTSQPAPGMLRPIARATSLAWHQLDGYPAGERYLYDGPTLLGCYDLEAGIYTPWDRTAQRWGPPSPSAALAP